MLPYMETFVGRPKKLNPLGNRFLKLYLDPLNSAVEICSALGISLPTFYKYEKELNLPHLTVAIGNSSSHLPYKKALQGFTSPCEQYELLLFRSIAQHIGARIKLEPRGYGSNTQEKVRTEKVDFAMTSLSWTQEGSKTLYYSNSYLLDSTPSGVLVAMKNRGPNLSTGRSKPILAVTKNGVHSEFAEKNLKSGFSIKQCRNFAQVFKLLASFEADVALFNERLFSIYPEETKEMQIISKPFIYDSYTAMVFHKNSMHLIPEINKAIEIVHEKKLVPTERAFLNSLNKIPSSVG